MKRMSKEHREDVLDLLWLAACDPTKSGSFGGVVELESRIEKLVELAFCVGFPKDWTIRLIERIGFTKEMNEDWVERGIHPVDFDYKSKVEELYHQYPKKLLDLFHGGFDGKN